MPAPTISQIPSCHLGVKNDGMSFRSVKQLYTTLSKKYGNWFDFTVPESRHKLPYCTVLQAFYANYSNIKAQRDNSLVRFVTCGKPPGVTTAGFRKQVQDRYSHFQYDSARYGVIVVPGEIDFTDPCVQRLQARIQHPRAVNC